MVNDSGDVAVAVAVDGVEENQELEQELEQLRQRLAADLAGVYELESELGSGGMAYVFKATEVELGRQVALKVLRPHLLTTASAAERFRQEARIAAGLEHPNVIPIHRVGQAGGAFYIAMKFIEGRSLFSIVESQGPLSLPIVLNILRASLSALAHAHEHGIVHRDIKGGNILIDTEGRVIVADFGIARPLEDTGLTATGALVGTPAFMSPEQWAGGRITAQSDQYAVGILAFQLLTGSEPFEGDSLPVVMQHHLLTSPPDVRAARADVPSALVAMVNRALAKDPAERYPTTRDMLTAVEAISFSDADRRESTDGLRQLARGSTIEKVRTHPLPPLPDIHSQLMHLGRGVAVARKLVRRWPTLVTTVAGLLALLGATLWFWPGPTSATDSTELATISPTSLPTTARPDTAPATLRQRTSPAPAVERAPRLALPTGTGKLRLRTIPAIAAIHIDGREVSVGLLFDHEVSAGTRRLTVVAPGYVTFDTVLTILRGGTVTLKPVTLKVREPAP